MIIIITDEGEGEGGGSRKSQRLLYFIIFTVHNNVRTRRHTRARTSHTSHHIQVCASCRNHAFRTIDRPADSHGVVPDVSRARIFLIVLFISRALWEERQNPILFFYPTITVIVHFMAPWRCWIAITVHCIRSGNRRHCVDVTRPSTFIWRLIRKSRIPSTFVVVM